MDYCARNSCEPVASIAIIALNRDECIEEMRPLPRRFCFIYSGVISGVSRRMWPMAHARIVVSRQRIEARQSSSAPKCIDSPLYRSFVHRKGAA